MLQLIGTAANIASETAKVIFQEAKYRVGYVINYKKMVEKFEEKMKSLIAKRESVQQEVDAAQRNMEKILPDIELWCERVDKTIDEESKKVKELQEKAKAKCFLGLCPNIKSRYQLSKKAEEDVVAVNDLLQQGRFDKIAVPDAPKPLIRAASKNFKLFDSRKKVFDEIMKALTDPTIKMIGVYGPGGVGKTTLVDEVVRQVKKAKSFGSVVKATVTLTPNIEEIQRQIAESLGLKLEEKTMEARASKLSERLKKEKIILVVLDDLWARLSLDEVGIPFGDQHRGCKILLTSRNRNVLTDEMDVKKTIAIGVLEEEEAWDLFKKMAENDFEDLELLSIATEISKRCGGLPLAIATVARALRNKALHAWKDAFRQLQRPSPGSFTVGIPAAVYSAVELSYNQLQSEELKQTFLLSCLLGRNAQIERLLRWAIGLHLFEGVDTVEETRNRLLTMVSNLKASCLLIDGYDKDHLSMHDFIYDVALSIASRDKDAFVLKDWPDEERVDRFKMIILDLDSIEKLPLELDCPQLSLLVMGSISNLSYVQMPTSFSENMKNIKVLDLVRMDLSSSMSLPTSLRTLSLVECKLRYVVNLSELKNLEILCIFDSVVKRLPWKMGELTKLRILDLSYCTELEIIKPGIFSRLSSLEEVYICVFNANFVPKDLFYIEKLQRYKIMIGRQWGWDDDIEYSRTVKLSVNLSIDVLDTGLKQLLMKTEALYLEDLVGVRVVLDRLYNLDYLLHLNHLHIGNASGIKYVINDHVAIDKIAFHQLRSLTLQNLPRLVSFCFRNRSMGLTFLPSYDQLPLFGEQMELPCLENLHLSFINVGRIWDNKFSTISNNTLTSLVIMYCDNLRYLLSSSMAVNLVNLKSFEIINCQSLIEIIFNEDRGKNNVTLLFPKLILLN